MDKINKLKLPATIIIASIILGGFYFVSQVNKQRSIERQQEIKIEQEKQERLAKKQAKEEAYRAFSNCIANAEENYSDMWTDECKVQGKLTNKCIDVNELDYDEYLKKYGLTSEEYVKQRNLTLKDPDDPSSVHLSAMFDYIVDRPDECSCRLPTSIADRFNEQLKEAKDRCFKRHPQK